MQETILAGILMGVTLAVTVGPSFFGMITLSIAKGRSNGFKFAAGVNLSDLFIVVGLTLASKPMIEVVQYKTTLLYSALFLLIYGIGSLFFVSKKKQQNSIKNPFINGLVINTSNPSVYLIWIGFSAICPDKLLMIYYLFTILLVNFSIDILKVAIAARMKDFISPNLKKYSKYILSITFIVTGSILFYNYINF
jgi:threonine/homoserine/homoserine lactone efflux protein